MLNLKPEILNPKPNKGFTLIELLVVIAIMVLLTGAMVINLNGQRASRDLKIAQAQLVSNIRKIQSYTLSSRLLPSGQGVQYYVLKFNLAKPTQYTIQAMYNVSSSPQYLQDVETINLPPNIQIATSPGALSITRPVNPNPQNPSTCALVAFASPFGKVFLNDGCTPANPISPYVIGNTDDYKKIVNFVINTPCDVNGNPFGCTTSTDSKMTITLTDKTNTLTKTVTVNGITGLITFN